MRFAGPLLVTALSGCLPAPHAYVGLECDELHACAPGLTCLEQRCVEGGEATLFGDGRDGTLEVTQPALTVNRTVRLTQAADAGAVRLSVAPQSTFAAGDRVLVIQSAQVLGVPPAAQGVVDVGPLAAGRWQAGRLTAVGVDWLELETALTTGFLAEGAQVVRVPQYETVTVRAGASLVAPPWNGSEGGVLALMVRDRLVVEGALHADAAGFRGGVAIDSPNAAGCSGADQPAPDGAAKGEGLWAQRFGAATGLGSLYNGGGGGVCDQSGGGGGANAGPGGAGGRSNDASRDVGGRGGAALADSSRARLFFGGGGGAGHGNDGNSGVGGRGGGAVWLRTAALSGGGTLSANGARAVNARFDGASGGGGGGTLAVRAGTWSFTGTVSANGGAGGSVEVGPTTMVPHGPGGGGGGGVIHLQSKGPLPAAVARPGAAGTDPNSPASLGATHGAAPATDADATYAGVVTVLEDPAPAPERGCGCGGAPEGVFALLGLLARLRRAGARSRPVTSM